MMAASVIMPQERKSFYVFLLKHLNVDLKLDYFCYNGYDSRGGFRGVPGFQTPKSHKLNSLNFNWPPNITSSK